LTAKMKVVIEELYLINAFFVSNLGYPKPSL
jgi:hypothetical protein